MEKHNQEEQARKERIEDLEVSLNFTNDLKEFDRIEKNIIKLQNI